MDCPVALAERRAIYEAIRARDADAAVAAIIRHINVAEERFTAALTKNAA